MAHFDVSGKVFLITGAATGLGAALAEELLKLGAKFTAILDIDENTGKNTEKNFNEKYGANKAQFLKCDVTNDEELTSAYDQVIKLHKHVDVVVNNAGIMNDSRNCFKKAIEVNYIALVNSSLKAIEHMRVDSGGSGGTIVNISSLLGIYQNPVLPIYSGTKAAVLQFSNLIGMDQHFSRTNVRVITMCFGATDTKLLHNPGTITFDEETGKGLEMATKHSKIQRPESAALGTVEAIKRGASGSTWLAADDKPVQDITESVRQAYQDMSGWKPQELASK